MKQIAVALVHGIEIDDPDFGTTPIRLLRDGLAKELGHDGPDPEDVIVVEPINWAPYLEVRQRELFDRVFPEGAASYFDGEISSTIKKINAGSGEALAPLLVSLARYTVPPLRSLHYPTARWMAIHFVGDVIAYDRGADQANYIAVHEAFAHGLAALARRAGEDAPLCVIAHSFGTVLVSDYFYDQQEAARGRVLVPEPVRRAMGPSALARGETLTWLYTMGSPLALWSLRYPKAELARPIDVPAKQIADRYPDLQAEWVNVYDKNDVMAYPLKPLSAEYECAVTEDRAVSVKGFPVAVTPLVHPFYWAERSVMEPIARRLGAAWRQLNQ